MSGNVLEFILELLKKEGVVGDAEDICANPSIEFKHPHELKEILKLSFKASASSKEELETLLKSVVRFSVKTNSNGFHNQLYGGVDQFGLAGTWLTEALNTNQHTFEVAPVFTLIEQAVIEHVLGKVGFQNGDGIFTPGGSASNMYAMTLARFKKVPQIKSKGLKCCQQLVAFTSEDSHYSLRKSAHWLGLGTDNLIVVKTDELGRMIQSELDRLIGESIDEGKCPFFVNATAGTTVLGAFDKLDEIHEICQKYDVWLHVDACWGGSLLLSRTYRSRMENINRVNSVSWNPHKMLGAPLQCSLFLVNDKHILHECNSADVNYLFQQDKFYDVSYDTGNKSIQCGRKVDAFKLYFMWTARGEDGFEQLVDNAMDCARYFKQQIENRDGFKLVLPEFECTNVCFWFIPEQMRNNEMTPEWWEKINQVAPKIKELMTMSGSIMVGYTPLGHKGLKNFFRMVTTCHTSPKYEDMDFIINEIEKYGTNLEI